MNTVIRSAVCILLAMLAPPATARELESVPVVDMHPSHLGVTVEAPGREGWFVTEMRYKNGWRIMYRHGESGDRSRIVFLKSDRWRAGKFAKEHGSLEQLSRQVFAGNRSPDDAQYTEKRAELLREDLGDAEAYRIRIVVEERNNPLFPGMVLVMENFQLLMLHPRNPDQVISIAVSTRHAQDQEPLGADELLGGFAAALKFE